MTYVLTFMAGMVFAVAVIVWFIGMPTEAMKYLSGVVGTLLFAWAISGDRTGEKK